MSVFLEQNIGKTLTEAQRLEVIEEIYQLYLASSPYRVKQAVRDMIELTGHWTEDMQRECLDHDMQGMLKTLKTGIITM